MRNVLIFFSLMLLLLVGGVFLLGNPEGSADAVFASVSTKITELGLNESDIKACIDAGKYTERVNRDILQGKALGITGTPTIILLDRETKKTVMVSGAYPFESLKVSIDKLLAGEVQVGDTIYENADIGIKMVVGQVENIGLVEDDHLRGGPEARIALIEYTDLDCQYCAKFNATALMLGTEFGEDLVWVHRHFPIASLHPNAFNKAQLLECAAEQGGAEAFWNLADTYYANSLK